MNRIVILRICNIVILFFTILYQNVFIIGFCSTVYYLLRAIIVKVPLICFCKSLITVFSYILKEFITFSSFFGRLFVVSYRDVCIRVGYDTQPYS